MEPGKEDQGRLQSLPDDMLRIIVSKLGSSSALDFCNARLSCKSLRFDLSDNVIAKDLKLSSLVKNPLKAKCYKSLIDACLKVDNLDAHFIEGVLQFFDKGNKYLGLHHLQITSRGGHPEGTYLYGVMLMCFGRYEKGKNVINNLTDTAGITVVQRSWETIQTALSNFTLVMKPVYLESYETMQPQLHCHPDELNTVCSKCFHFFLMSEFIEMIIGLNTIP